MPDINQKNKTVSQPIRWRLIPTAILSFIGIISLAIGMTFVAILFYSALTEGISSIHIYLLLGCSMYLIAGAFSILASRLFYTQCYRSAVLTSVVGFLLPLLIYFVGDALYSLN